MNDTAIIIHCKWAGTKYITNNILCNTRACKIHYIREQIWLMLGINLHKTYSGISYIKVMKDFWGYLNKE